ncbi:MAG: methyltransferase type 12 [Rhodobacteraceae bacterium]|nr:methyltransferase type 12 [Paracoccaceae bacterium]
MVTNPYDASGFYDDAIARGRHRDIVGGRWDETGRIQMQILRDAGLCPHHHLLDIGAGSMRLGCKAVPYLEPGHYWATDASRALMLAGRAAELADPDRLDPAQLIEDAGFACPGVPDRITHAIAFAVFPHVPRDRFQPVFATLRRFPRLELFLFTVFLVPDEATAEGSYRQPDGVVTHGGRPPYHLTANVVQTMAAQAGWQLEQCDVMLPRGQVLFRARPQGTAD